MTIEVPIQMKYLLDRSSFEKNRAISNMTFVLGQHIQDKNDSFLSSELYQKLEDRLIEALASEWSYSIGVVTNILGKTPEHFGFKENNKIIVYQ